MRFSLMILSVTAVLATDFAVKNINIGADGTLWYQTIDNPAPARETRLPDPIPDAIPVAPSAGPVIPAIGNLPQGPDLWDMSEVV
jgi:hypothetical protein